VEIRQIRYFLSIVDEGSLSKAAQSLYLTQPTLSRFLEKLESELGTVLFTKSKNNTLVLTEAGKVYLKTARKIDALWSKMDAELAGLRKTDDCLTFGVAGDYLLPFAAECAEKVSERYPHISVSYFSDSSREIQRLVAEGEISVGLCAFDKKDPRLAYTVCSKVEMNLVVSKNNPLAASSYRITGQDNLRITLSQLGTDTQFAMMRGNTYLRKAAENYLSERKYTPKVTQTYLRHASVADVVGNSALVGFCPANNLSDKLAYIALDPPFSSLPGICRPKKTVLTPAEKMLVGLLKKMPAERIFK